MNNIPDHILRVFGGPIPEPPIKEINPLIVLGGVGLFIVAIIIFEKKNKEA